ncbi:MAG: hypothetical protein IGR76_18340 [Synechococcales cyanobacterium T60_A2020_003]|nr:hypothetical protein [Synechococcales cyanobacterium T60_A2020_003]
MASPEHVRQYLAYWFQLGKRVLLKNGEESLLPEPVFQGNRYSDSFERCWNYILRSESGDCYLEGTRQTIAELLSPSWDVVSCARCDMPVPMIVLGNAADSVSCPCSDLPSWPDTELPAPRSAVDSTDKLDRIRRRLDNVVPHSSPDELASRHPWQ